MGTVRRTWITCDGPGCEVKAGTFMDAHAGRRLLKKAGWRRIRATHTPEGRAIIVGTAKDFCPSCVRKGYASG